LSAGEAQQIKTKTQEGIKAEIAQAKYSLLPEWVQKIKLRGDARFRYFWNRKKGTSSSTPDNSAAQIRLRLGLDAKINEQMKAGVGIATGTTSNPRSTNVTLGGDSGVPASFKNIILDYAYGSYMPTTWATITAGKFKSPIWQPTDLLWDTDLNPEGLNLMLDYRLNPTWGLFLNSEMFWLQQMPGGSQQVMWVAQPGINYSWQDKISARAAVAGYFFQNIKGNTAFTNSNRTNSVDGSSKYKYNYNSVNPSIEVNFKEPFAKVPVLRKYVPFGGLYGDFIYNPDPDTGRGGFDLGLKFGNEKIGEFGQWQAKFLYAKLGRDSWLDILPDSDRYSGKTNMRSYEAILEYGLGKNTSIVLDYYWGESLSKTSGGSHTPQQLLQIDWNLKF
jgi:hypothetical protein